jgi:hypothetical protein
MKLAGLLIVLLALVGGCGDNDAPPDAAELPTDAGVDACICEPHWPACPPGCMPPTSTAQRRPRKRRSKYDRKSPCGPAPTKWPASMKPKTLADRCMKCGHELGEHNGKKCPATCRESDPDFGGCMLVDGHSGWHWVRAPWGGVHNSRGDAFFDGDSYPHETREQAMERPRPGERRVVRGPQLSLATPSVTSRGGSAERPRPPNVTPAAQCESCTGPIPDTQPRARHVFGGKGRPRRFCGEVCRQRASRKARGIRSGWDVSDRRVR